MQRYEARGMRLIGGFADGKFRISLGEESDQDGSQTLELGTGQHVVLSGETVVTVLPEYANPRLFSAAVSHARLMEFEGKV